MSDSILNSTKQTLGLAADYTAYDVDVLTFINSTLSTLAQIGVGPPEGFFITDDAPTWDDLGIAANTLAMVRSYVSLKVRVQFDPPATSFVLEAMKEQIAQYEWRLNQAAESLSPLPVVMPVRPKAVSGDDVVYVPVDTYIEGGY